MSPDPSTNEHLDDLLEEAISALAAGDPDAARRLTGEVLAADAAHPEAGPLLASIDARAGEVRRLTLMFVDLVGSTELSGRIEPEMYRALVGRYLETCRSVVEDRHDGHSSGTAGDGMLVLFGYPRAHEDDPVRAVTAGLDVCEAVRALSHELHPEVGEELSVRVGVHRGLVYVDTDDGEIYGLGANVAARVQSLAEPGTVVISGDLAALVEDHFELEESEPRQVKGLEAPLVHFRVVGTKVPDVRMMGRWHTPLIGRADELAQLRRAWRERRDGGSTRGLLVHGEPGMGKSRLVGALVDEVRADGGAVVVLAGSPRHTDTGFHPVRRWLDAMCRIGATTDAGERLRLLRLHLLASGLDPDSLAPLLAPVLGLQPEEAGYRPVAAEARLLNDLVTDAVVQLLHAEFGGSYGVLVVDDVQWLDDPSRVALDRFVASDAGAILTIMVSRGAEVPVPPQFEEVDVRPLPLAALHQLVEALGAADLPDSRRAALIERSDGVPLYLEELIRGELAHASDAAVPAAPPTSPGRAGGARGEIPDVLYEPLLAQLQATDGAVEVAAAAAAIGRELAEDVLAEVVELERDDLDRTLRSLLGGLILERVGDEGNRYRFRHELLRDVAYDLLPPSGRRRTHGKVAGALLARAADGAPADWRLIAEHHDQAGQAREAAQCYQRAAEEARNRGGLAEARTNLTRAIELFTELDDPADRRREVDLRLRRGFLAVATEGNASTQAALDYERCMELAMDQPEGADMVSTLYALWAHYASRGQLDQAQRLTELVREMEMVRTTSSMLAASTGAFGTVAFFRGDFARARRLLEESIAGVVSAPDLQELSVRWFLPNDMQASMHLTTGLARWATGDPAGADQQIEQAVQRAVSLPFPQGPFTHAYTYAYAGWVAIEQGALDRAHQLVTELTRLGTEHGFDFWTVIAQSLAVMLEAQCRRAGHPSRDAAEVADELAGLIGVIGFLETRLFLPADLSHLARMRLELGELDAARASIEESLALGQEMGAHFYDAETMRLKAHLAHEPSEVEMGLREALAVAEQQQMLPFRVRIAADLHRLIGARAELEAALAGFAPGASYPELDEARARLEDG